MKQNYHLHTTWSGDGQSSMEELCRAAAGIGLTHIAITDHHDPELERFTVDDFKGYIAEIDRCRELFPELSIARGVELDYRPSTWEEVKCLPQEAGLDFALLSLHFIDGVDPYLPEYFAHRTQREGYVYYLERLMEMLRVAEGPFVLGHITYVSKFARFDHPVLSYADYSDLLDSLLALAVQKGFGLEVNASGLRNNAGTLPGTDILLRYRQLGGEIITLGSDGHSAADVGFGLAAARQAALDAGFQYAAAWRGLQPVLLPMD